MSGVKLTAEQEAEAKALADKIREKFEAGILEMARGFVTRPDHELLGPGEYVVRDQALRLGALALESALETRKKGVRGC